MDAGLNYRGSGAQTRRSMGLLYIYIYIINAAPLTPQSTTPTDLAVLWQSHGVSGAFFSPSDRSGGVQHVARPGWVLRVGWVKHGEAGG